MTLPAALPSAALRLTRTAAGRRALHVVLLVGGLFALGFLCGEQAHAADGAASTAPTQVVQVVSGSVERAVAPGTPAPKSGSVPSSTVKHASGIVTHASGSVLSATATHVSGSVPLGMVDRVSGSVPSGRGNRASGSVLSGAVRQASGSIPHAAGAVAGVTDTVRRVVQPVGDLVVQPAVDKVVRPVGDLVKTVTGGLVDTSGEGLPSLPGRLPDVSGLPDVPGLPVFPGVGAQAPPVASVSHPSSGVREQPSVAIEHDAGRLSDAPATTTPYGPSRLGAGAGGGVAARGGHIGVRAGQSPAPQAPPGDPAGALDDQCAVDSGTPRHGDPHAVTPHHQAPLRLVRGASAVVTAAETRDRFRDIPVFPG